MLWTKNFKVYFCTSMFHQLHCTFPRKLKPLKKLKGEKIELVSIFSSRNVEADY